MFPAIEYLEWIDGRPGAATHDLATSEIIGDRPDGGDRAGEEAVVPDALSSLPPPDDATLESLLAAAYDVAPENVLVTASASVANAVAVATALDLGPDLDDRDPQVLVEKPAYEPLRATPRGLGGRVDRFRRPEEDGSPVDPDRVAAATDGAALAVVTNRHNPSGRLLDREALAAVARVAADAGARVLVDEVYAPYVGPGGTVDGAFGGPTGAGLPNVVATGSLTKFFGLGGLKIGWIVADAAFVDAATTVAWHLPAVATPSRTLARRALANRTKLAADARDVLARNHRLLASFVDERGDVDGPVHEGCPYAFLDVAGADGDEVAAAASEAGVLVVPGRFFEDPDRVRVSLGRDPDGMAAALSAFGDALDDAAG